MIEVSHLSKRFPGRKAVDDVSFSVKSGEIVGFLGPNGAGKSTTMRILAGFIPPTSGTVRVAGYDVVRQSQDVRRCIGYLPENCPLYPEMRVDEYLAFRAGLKRVPSRYVHSRVEEVKAMCGLGDMGRRIIGQLSKGYRQRVGLADSLVHDPELLILDEPTIGLDPHQIRHVRSLIAELAKHHTILLSTHILSEIEMSCHRVLIIDHGKIVASESPAALRLGIHGREKITAEIRGPRPDVEAALNLIDNIAELKIREEDGWVHCEILALHDIREAIFDAVHRAGWSLRELRHERKSLEDIFVALTADGAGGKP
jgi:ABC-2 type transport system ATP-binding protein